MIKKIIAILLIASPAMASFSGWTYQRIVTISSANVSNVLGTLSNFPVLVSTNVPSISTNTTYGHMTGLYDQGFYSDSNCQFSLNWDTETINNTGSTSTIVWVQVPTLTTATLTAATFYWCYDKASVTTYIGHSTGTWDSDFKVVYHFPNGTTLSPIDSTSNGQTLSNAGAVAMSGIIDGGASFNGSVWMNTPATISIPTSITMEEWVNSSSLSTQSSVLVSKEPVNTQWLTLVSGAQVFLRGGNTANDLTTATPSNSVWHQIVGTISGTSGTLYVDGILKTSGTSTAIGNGAGVVDIGAYGQGTGVFNYTGSLDEVRISDIARNSDWVKTEYNNQNSPGTFITIGSEVQSGGTVPASQNRGLLIQGGRITINGAKVTIL